MAGVTHRCQEHTELLVHELKLGLLWDGWGIVGDVVVGVLLPFLVPIVTFYRVCHHKSFLQLGIFLLNILFSLTRSITVSDILSCSPSQMIFPMQILMSSSLLTSFTK